MYNSIVVDKNSIYALVGYKEGGKLWLKHAYKKEREDTVLNDVRALINENNLPKTKTCIVVEADINTNFLQIPKMERAEVYQILNYQKEKLIDWDDEICTQFIVRYPSLYDEDKMDIFLVGVEKELIIQAGMALIKGGLNIDIITYWPGEIMRIYDLDRQYANIILEEDSATFCYWDEENLVKSVKLEPDVKSVARFLEKWEEENREYPILGIDILLEDCEINEDERYDWQAIEEHYGKLKRRPVRIDGELSEEVVETSLQWQLAIGGLIRGLRV